jgi:7-cyano-7-deazaguanine synthase
MEMTEKSAIVVFSGGQDSTTCLFWAMENFSRVLAVTFDYGQRHRVELDISAEICHKFGIPREVIPVSSIKTLGGNSLTSENIAVPEETPSGELPNTFVPGRNILFLTLAAAYGYQKDIYDLVTGVGEADYSGYPDCREDFIKSMEETLYRGTEKRFSIHRPLMFLDKAGIWELSDQLGHLEDVVSLTHTCYRGERAVLHPWGYGCGTCPACRLRKAGYEKYMEKKHGVSSK